jgi:membrane peptidoglycan carboxypeptidase
METSAEFVKTDIDLVPNGKMPFPGSSLFVFEATTQPEGIIHIDREGGILITCDSIKNWTQIDNYFSEQTGKAFMQQGLIKSANVDTVWVNAMRPKIQNFKRLLTSFKFQHLLSAHGQPLLNSAYTKVSQSIDQLK